MADPWVGPTDHAVEALGLFYPGANGHDVIREVRAGIEIEPQTAVALVGRTRTRPGNRYVLHRERTGLFALDSDGTVKTFLRFYALAQHKMACRLWPGGDPPTTTEPLWASGRTLGPDCTRTDPGMIKVSSGARDKVSSSKEEIAEAVRAAIKAGAMEEPGDLILPHHHITGIVQFKGHSLAVAFTETDIRVGVPILSPEAMKAQLAASRKAAGIEQAAELLRANGWTVAPPEPQAQTGGR